MTMSNKTRLWTIAAMLFLATMLNYADRLTLSVVSTDLRQEFNMTEQDYSHVLTLFMLAYAIMYAGSGIIVDKLGAKKGFAFFIFGWSLAQMLHAATVGKWSLAGARFFLGLCEPGNWPAAVKAVNEWFPPAQRALGVGIFNAGSSLGSAIAPPMVAAISIAYGWKAAFLFTGSLGFVWLIAWLFIYETPENKQAEAIAVKVDWRQVITARACYTLLIARFFTDPVIYFMIFWLPEYLRKERAFSLSEVGHYAWVPFIFGDIGYVLGGWLSGKLIDRGWEIQRARKFVMYLGAAVMPVAILAPYAPSAGLAIAASCFVTFGHAFWVSNLQALPADLFKPNEVATASGFTGMGGAIGGMLANLGTGYLVMNFSYTPVFLIAGLMHPLSAIIIYFMLKNTKLFQEKQ